VLRPGCILDSEGDGGDVERIKQSEWERKPSLANVMVFTNLSNGEQAVSLKKRGEGKKYKVRGGVSALVDFDMIYAYDSH